MRDAPSGTAVSRARGDLEALDDLTFVIIDVG